MRRARAGRGFTYGRVFYKSKAGRRWQVSFFAPPARPGERTKEVSQTVVDDRSGRVLESWTGYKVEWTMARGYAGAFGRVANALWIWLPLCALFVLPFARPPLRLLHLDLAVLLAFSVSYAFFNAARIDVSVPLVYPLLVYLLARMLGIAFSRARGREPPPLRLALPVERARDRRRVPARRPLRAEPRRLERHRRRLRERDRRRPLRIGRGGVRRTSRPTTRAGTPTARSSTTPTFRSRRCCRGAAAGTSCRRPTPPRSRSTC